MIGASGAVARCAGAYLILFPFTDCEPGASAFHLHHHRNSSDDLPGLLVCLAALFQVVRGREGGSGSGIAWWAHIGGFYLD